MPIEEVRLLAGNRSCAHNPIVAAGDCNLCGRIESHGDHLRSVRGKPSRGAAVDVMEVHRRWNLRLPGACRGQEMGSIVTEVHRHPWPLNDRLTGAPLDIPPPHAAGSGGVKTAVRSKLENLHTAGISGRLRGPPSSKQIERLQ